MPGPGRHVHIRRTRTENTWEAPQTMREVALEAIRVHRGTATSHKMRRRLHNDTGRTATQRCDHIREAKPKHRMTRWSMRTIAGCEFPFRCVRVATSLTFRPWSTGELPGDAKGRPPPLVRVPTAMSHPQGDRSPADPLQHAAPAFGVRRQTPREAQTNNNMSAPEPLAVSTLTLKPLTLLGNRRSYRLPSQEKVNHDPPDTAGAASLDTDARKEPPTLLRGY